MRIAKSWCPHQKKMSKEKMGKEMGREKVGKEKNAHKEKKKGKNLKKIRCTKQGCCGLPKLGQPHHGLDSSWAGQPQHGLDSPPMKTKNTST